MILLFLALLLQPPPPLTATQVYTAYREAVTTATDFADLRPFLAASVRAQIDALPDADRPRVFGLLKLSAPVAQITQITETTLTDGSVVLVVRGVDSQKRPVQGIAECVREGDTWKLLRETWQHATGDSR